jgi:spectinomycin phosphotransferase
LVKALAEGWHLRAASMEHVPEGGGAYHWKLVDEGGQPHFVTVDFLGDREWMGETRQAVFTGLGRALSVAVALRDDVGLEFVVAPIAARDGELMRRLDDQYAVSVFPFLAGRSYPFGPYPDARLRGLALDMIAALHRSTAALRDRVPQHVPRFACRGDLEAFLLEPDRPWEGGPFSPAARGLLATRAAGLAQLTACFDSLADRTMPARADPVITHGEPHPANIMSVGDRLVLIDWDTVAMAPPERDVSLIVTAGNEGVEQYQEAMGRELDPALITLYRLRWYLDDIASAIRLFRNRHHDTPDTRRWWDGLAPRLERLPEWLDRLSHS